MKRGEDFTLNPVCQYYSDKVTRYGATEKGVDWPNKESQYLRFAQLLKIIDANTDSFTISDLGCGYGELITFLKGNFKCFNYFGYDISQSMLDHALLKWDGIIPKNNFILNRSLSKITDYAVASGLFNVRLDIGDDDWLRFIMDTLDNLNANSKLGFAFNCLTKYSDEDKMKDYLYYADPLFLFNYCKKNFSRNVALLHDYDLYEFTILVRK